MGLVFSGSRDYLGIFIDFATSSRKGRLDAVFVSSINAIDFSMINPCHLRFLLTFSLFKLILPGEIFKNFAMRFK